MNNCLIETAFLSQVSNNLENEYTELDKVDESLQTIDFMSEKAKIVELNWTISSMLEKASKSRPLIIM